MADGSIPEAVEDQAANSLKNLETIMKEAGTDKSRVVKTTIFLTDMGDFGKVNEVYGLFLRGSILHDPAWLCGSCPKGPGWKLNVWLRCKRKCRIPGTQ